MEVSSLLTEGSTSTSKRLPPKTIAFELLLDEGSKTRARIPLRILVNLHDDTESIITTVKNFYGIYDGQGVSFEDVHGNVLIARYENLPDKSVVYVRTVVHPVQSVGLLQYPHGSTDPQRRTSLNEVFQIMPPHMYEQTHSPSRPSSRLARKRSTSPTNVRGRRSASQQKPSSFSASRGSSVNGSSHGDDAANGYSDSDAGRSSVTGSKKARSEQFASAEISLENVVQEGRRGHTLFESSVLPLFVPPQVPITASQSSISPQRRSQPQDGPSPFHPPPQNLPIFNQPLASPRSSNYDAQRQTTAPELKKETNGPYSATTHGHRLRERSAGQQNGSYTSARAGFVGTGVLPTPDPTVASCISDEDVARQLIALGDLSNFSHGRTSNSTMDDTFSGVADAASSTGATSDSEEYSEDDPLPKHRRLINEHDETDYYQPMTIKNETEDYEGVPRTKKIKTKLFDGPSQLIRGSKTASGTKNLKSSKVKSSTMHRISKHSGSPGLVKMPAASPTTGQPRKTSSSSSVLNFQNQLGIDEEDLSSKPRCQRCRKSKKGCDRQRPCGRCKDAGIGIEGCLSEDEGNGRKGRYGRHMGVSVRRSGDSVDFDDESELAGAILNGMATDDTVTDKSRKRKR